MFDDEEQLQYCMGVAEETKEVLQAKLDDKRKQAKKDGKTSIEEDDPIKVILSCQRLYNREALLFWGTGFCCRQSPTQQETNYTTDLLTV